MSKHLIYFVFILFFRYYCEANAQPHDIRFSAQIDRPSVPQNQVVTLTITLEWIGPASLYEVEEITQPTLNNLQVIGSGSHNQVVVAGGEPHTKKDYRFELKPDALGMAYVEPIRLKYFCLADSQITTVQTQRLEVKVTEPVIEKSSNTKTHYFFWPSLAIIIILAVKSYQRKKRRQAELIAAAQGAMTKSPAEQIRAELRTALDVSQPEQIEQKCDAMTLAVRKFLRICRRVDAASLPTAELAGELQNRHLDAGEIELLIAILNACDEVRFAKKPLPITEFDSLVTKFERLLAE